MTKDPTTDALDRLRAEIERLRFYETTSAADAIHMLQEARARLALLEPVFEIASRWCSRPHSVTSEWLANDAEMFARLRAAVDAVNARSK